MAYIDVIDTYKRYKAKDKADIDKIAQALQKLTHEDQTLRVVNDAENRQTLIYGMGDQHLDIVVSRLLNEYKVEVELSQPKVAFRETIKKTSDVEAKHKKQSGGHGQYGHVKMRFMPASDPECGYEFEQEVVGGAVPKNFFPAVEKGLRESIQKGPLAGYPMVGIKATLYDGSYHPVDSSEMSFKMAASAAYKAGVPQANPVLLEPFATASIMIPDSNMGDIMGEVNKRRGRILGMNPGKDNMQIVEAEVPVAEMSDFSVYLRQVTQGRGSYEFEVTGYEQVPGNIAEKIIAEAKKKA